MMIGMGIAIPLAQPQFSVAALFAAGEQGGWWDPSDLSTLYQDSAGTTPVTATTQPVGMILDKRLGAVRGAEQVLDGGFTTGVGWTIVGTATISGGKLNVGANAGGALIVTNTVLAVGWYELTYTIESITGSISFGCSNVNAGTGQSAPGTYREIINCTTPAGGLGFFGRGGGVTTAVIDNASVKPLAGNHRTQATAASRPTLQQDASGYYYLNYDGVDDFMVTGNVDFTGTAKATLWTGVNKQSDAAGQIVIEQGANSSGFNGFGLIQPGSAGFWQTRLFGATGAQVDIGGYPAPASNVISCAYDISAAALSEMAPRINGAVPGAMTPSGDAGTANLPNAPIFFGRRNGTTNPFTGREYGTIIRGAASDANTIARGERFIGSRMGIAL